MSPLRRLWADSILFINADLTSDSPDNEDAHVCTISQRNSGCSDISRIVATRSEVGDKPSLGASSA